MARADWKREVSLSAEFSSIRVVKMILKCDVCWFCCFKPITCWFEKGGV